MTASLNDFNRVLNDLVVSIQTDILPIIQPNKPEGGYFGVPRMIFCSIDFLGLLFCGWNGRVKDGKKQYFGISNKGQKFIIEVLGKIDKLYEVNGALLYDMYRHGTVHIHNPQKMASKKFSNKTIEWLIYKGDRETWDYYENRAIKLRHLKIFEWSNDRFILPVSISVLYGDLVAAVNLYRDMVYADKSGKLLKNFTTVANALNNVFDLTSHKFW